MMAHFAYQLNHPHSPLSSSANLTAHLPERIQGMHIALRPAAVFDAASLFRQCWGDPMVMRYQNFRLHQSVADSVHRLKNVQQTWESGEEFHWIITAKASGSDEPLGCISLSLDTTGKYNLGYSLARRFWSRGYATEAVGLLANWAFETGVAKLICAYCMRSNYASVRVLEKLGFARSQSFLGSHDLPNLAGSIHRVVDLYVLENSKLRQTQIC